MIKWIKMLLVTDYKDGSFAYGKLTRYQLIRLRVCNEIRYIRWLVRSYFCEHNFEEKTFIYLCSKCKKVKNK